MLFRSGAGGAGLARHVQSVLQGAFILAKSQDPAQAADMAKESIGHLRRYLELLLSPTAKQPTAQEPTAKEPIAKERL